MDRIGAPPPYDPGLDLPDEQLYRDWPIARLPGWVLRWLRRNRHLSIPAGLPLALLAAGRVLARDPAVRLDVLVIAAAATITAWFVAPQKWDPEPRWRGRRWTSEVAYARATVTGLGLWLVLAAWNTPDALRDVLLAVFCLPWGGIFWHHKRPRDRRARRRHAHEVARWNIWWTSHAVAWGIGGARVVGLTDKGPLQSLLIQLDPGRQSVANVKSVLHLIESALAGYVSHGMTRVAVNSDDPSQVWLHLKRADPLREEISWSPAMAPTDITKPAPLGVREGGQWLMAVLRSGWFILGRTRWGKSNELSVLLATITACRNARFILIDRKGGRAARPWLPAATWVATTLDEARFALGCMVAEVGARGTHAYVPGEEQLTPTDDCPTWFVVVDEAYWVTSEMAGDARCASDLAIIASAGQGVEIYPIVLSQYGALPETVRTEQTRSNLNYRLCFQTEVREHGVFALGDDAYNNVDTTKLREKGQFFYRTNAETSPEQIRGPHMDHATARATAIANAEATGIHTRPVLLYCGAYPCEFDSRFTWQQVFDTRWLRLPQAFHADAPAGVQLTLSPGDTEQPAMTKINIPAGDVETAAAVAAVNAEVDELAHITTGDIDDAARRRAERGDPPIDLAAQGDARKRRWAEVLTETGPDGISPKDLRAAAGLSESWTHLALAFLVQAGAVTRVSRGKYAPVPGTDIWGAIQAMRRDTDKLTAQAIDLVGSAS